MNRAYYITIASIVMFLSVITGTLLADERMKVIEMADGNTVSFPMTNEEIEEEVATKAEMARRQVRQATKPSCNVVIFEMGEGGHTISFPANKDDTRAVKAEAEKHYTNKDRNLSTTETISERVELPESGVTILFRSKTASNREHDNIKTARRYSP